MTFPKSALKIVALCIYGLILLLGVLGLSLRATPTIQLAKCYYRTAFVSIVVGGGLLSAAQLAFTTVYVRGITCKVGKTKGPC